MTLPLSFRDRHIGTTAEAQQHMLSRLGLRDIDDLMDRALPPQIRSEEMLDSAVPAGATETEALAELRELAGGNQVFTSMIGQGYYDTVTPSVIQRNVLENPAWYTAYTPYQPEISQGRLEALINFQTMVTDLTGLDTAGSSMLDEGTAAAEAMLLSMRVSRRDRRFLVDRDRKSTRLNSSHVAISYAVFC